MNFSRTSDPGTHGRWNRLSPPRAPLTGAFQHAEDNLNWLKDVPADLKIPLRRCGGFAFDESLGLGSDAQVSADLSMATHQNRSVSIFQPVGGCPLAWNGQALPPYCEEPAVNEIRSRIPSMPVTSSDRPPRPWGCSYHTTALLSPWACPVASSRRKIGAYALVAQELQPLGVDIPENVYLSTVRINVF